MNDQEFREDTKERLVRVETQVSEARREIAQNRLGIDENRLGIAENRREIQAVKTEVSREVQAAKTEVSREVQEVKTEVSREVQAVKADVRVILSKLEAREKRENRKLTIVGIIFAATASLLSAAISYFT